MDYLFAISKNLLRVALEKILKGLHQVCLSDMGNFRISPVLESGEALI